MLLTAYDDLVNKTKYLLKTNQNKMTKKYHVLLSDEKRFPSGAIMFHQSCDDYQKQITQYAETGFIEISSGYPGSLLSWKITDAMSLARILKIEIPQDIKNEIINQLPCLNLETTHILKDYFTKVNNLSVPLVINLFRIINYITDPDFEGGDVKSLSVAIFNNEKKDASKIFEKHIDTALSLICNNRNESSKDNLMEKLNIFKYKLPINIRGNIIIKDTTYIQNALMPPYICIHPEQFDYIEYNPHINGILTIENKTCFERYVREREHDNKIIIFTHGTPNSSILELLNILIKKFKLHAIYHWGDLDIGGLSIMNLIQERTKTTVIPVGWDIEKINNHAINSLSDYEKELTKKNNLIYNKKQDYIHAFARYVLLQNIRTEQENISPDEVILSEDKINLITHDLHEWFDTFFIK